MEWISTDTGFPIEEDIILVVNMNIDHPMFIRAYYEDDQQVFFPCDATFSFPLLVTHWAKIKKPKDKE